MVTLPPFALLYLIFSSVFLFWWLRNKRAPNITNWPIVGMVPGMICNASRALEFFNQLLQSSSGTFFFKGPWLSGFNFLITSDFNNVHYILSKNFANYGKGPELKLVFDSFGSDGLFNSEGEKWRLLRRRIHSLLRENRSLAELPLTEFFKFDLTRERATKEKIINGLFSILDNATENGTEVDMQDVSQRFMFDIISQMVLDYDPKCLSLEFPEIKYVKAFNVLEEVIFNRHLVPGSIWKLQNWLQIGGEKRGHEALETFDNFLYSCIATKREKLTRHPQKDKTNLEELDLLSYFMMETKEKDDEDAIRPLRNSDKFIRDIAHNMFAAGRDTISAGLSWLLWLVATHSTIEENIVKEIGEVIQAKQGCEKRGILTNKEELSQLVYLQATILETLRLYPPVPIQHVVSVEEDTLPSGHQIVANTRILLSFYSMGRMEEIWGEDSFEFEPKRWISEQGQIKQVPSSKFVAFNAGPRSCLGKEVSLVQMQMIALAMIWNYRFQVVEDHLVCPCNSINLHMKHGLKVRVFKRYE